MSRRNRFILLAVVGIIGLLVIMVLSLQFAAAPGVGNIFSNIITNLDTSRTPTPLSALTQGVSLTAILSAETSVAQANTDTPQRTPTDRPTNPPTMTPTEESDVGSEATEQLSPSSGGDAPTATITQTRPPPPVSDSQALTLTATALAELIPVESPVSPTGEMGSGLTRTPELAQTFLPETGGGEEAEIQGVEIASVPLLIRSDVSGEVIGDGTMRVYAPQSATFPDSVRVELELNVDNQYITPTPNGSSGTPVPRATTVASPGGATPTPYVPIITDSGVPVYQRMGATLFCPPGSFAGCDTARDPSSPSQTKLVNARTTTWSWLLSPSEAVSGLQELRIEAWLVERNLDGGLEILDLPGGQYRFSIEVNPASGLNPVIPIAGIVAVLAVIGGWLFLRRGRPAPTPTPTIIPRVAGKEPLVFISYRRGPTWGQARSIEQSLRKRGANVFIDIDDINEGKFAETIQKAIADCDFFLAVLAPGTLDSVWVRREIAHAIELKKTIVPLLIDGFHLSESTLPPDIQEIASHNAITVLPEFYEEAMDRLAKRFLRLGDS